MARRSREKIGKLGKLAERFKGWEPARDVLTEVRAVPTIFPQLDVATRCGGLPIQRISLLHGPSNHGKSALALGLGRSFLEGGHLFLYVDAEQTTPIDWARKLMGSHADSPAFRAMRPASYEQVVDRVREAADMLADLRAKGDISEETSALIVVDSLRKLVPKRLMAEVRKGAERAKGKGVDGLGGRAGQLRAAMNAAWMDELTPLVNHSLASVVLIARETENVGAGTFDVDYKVGGGASVIYESSLRIRVERARWIKAGTDDDSPVVGEQLRGTILKTKVGPKDDKHARFYFHTSNGVATPEGFDRARDVLHMAGEAGVIKTTGSWLKWAEQKWHGEVKCLAALREDAELLAAVENEARASFDPTTEPEQ